MSVFLFGVMWLMPSMAIPVDSTVPHRLLTWNIRYDNPADGQDAWPRRQEALAATIAGQRPDIVAVQEALSHQVGFLDARLKDFRRYGRGREDGVAKGEFCPVWFRADRYELLDSSTIWLSPTPSVPGKGWDAACERVATSLLLRDLRSGRILRVVNTHWDHVGVEARTQSAHMLAEMAEVASRDGHLFILLGDFNAQPGDPCLTPLTRWLQDACPPGLSGEGTFNGFDTRLREWPRIDHIWLPAGVRTAGYRVLRPQVVGRWQSDHFPVLVEVHPDR